MLPYAYSSLLPAKNSIRLVQLLPGEPGSDIHARMIDYTIREDQVSGLFEALSYVWGDPTDRRPIYIVAGATNTAATVADSSYLNVTVNLYAALQRLRDSAMPRTLWIDAICINQNDLAERAAQVRFMARIYSHALRVLVWLGHEGNRSGALLAMIEDIAIHLQLPQEEPEKISSLSSFRSAKERWEVESNGGAVQKELAESILKKAFGRHSYDPDVIQASLCAFLDRPWFHRLWVLQEIFAARHVTVICGTREVRGCAFTRGLAVLCRSSLAKGRVRNVGAVIVKLISWLSHTAGPVPSSTRLPDSDRTSISSIGQLLDQFHQHQSSDQRDKVFALLGMCNNTSTALDPKIEPDYNISWSSLFKNLIQSILGRTDQITTWEGYDKALVTAPGYILGTITVHTTMIVAQSADCFCNRSKDCSRTNRHHSYPVWLAVWPIEAWCKTVKTGDYLYLSMVPVSQAS